LTSRFVQNYSDLSLLTLRLAQNSEGSPRCGLLFKNTISIKAIYYILCFCAQTLIVFLVFAEIFFIPLRHIIKVERLDLVYKVLFLLFDLFGFFGHNRLKAYYF
jgi:hypothetical protein